MSSRLVSSELPYFTEQGSGPALLLIHGIMMGGEMFRPVAEHFAKQHRVIIPDLRGHSKSRRLPPPYTMKQLSEDLAKLLDHLQIGSADILGYSNGGTVAQQLTLDHPKKCNRLILACTYAYNMATFREKIEGHMVPLLIRFFGMKGFVNLIKKGLKELDRESIEWFTGIIANQDKKLMLSAWKEMLLFDSRPRLHEIKTPTLIIAASADEAVPIHHAKMLHKGIEGSQLKIVSGAGHALLWTNTEKFAALVDEFLAK